MSTQSGLLFGFKRDTSLYAGSTMRGSRHTEGSRAYGDVSTGNEEPAEREESR